MNTQSSIRSYITDLADQLGIRYQATPEDALAVIAARLAGDEVVTDETEDLIVALKRAGAINGREMVALLGRHLDEKFPAQ
ncbi:hypothetical protein [Marinobacter goseongensis]|uniref:hypothetical protein n=1 Tax=Marinobacter goseongensis TaxID=453838 RepID=UPI0020049CB8|nr:hypothetical protein [Marinobacter goseongensis]MCK7553254.1 hypothetical protein [Marinobacter goseongensis]